MDAKPLTLGDLELLIPRLRATLHEAERALQALYDVSGLLTDREASNRITLDSAAQPADANGVTNGATHASRPAGVARATPAKPPGRKRLVLKKASGRARGDDAEAVEALLLSFLKKAGKTGAGLSTILAETQLPKLTVNYRLRALRKAGRAKLVGNRRSARWLVA